MSSTGNVGCGRSGSGSFGSGNGVKNIGMEIIVEGYYKEVIREIIKEIKENMVVIYAHFYRMCKGWEIVQKTLEDLHLDVPGIKKRSIIKRSRWIGLR